MFNGILGFFADILKQVLIRIISWILLIIGFILLLKYVLNFDILAII